MKRLQGAENTGIMQHFTVFYVQIPKQKMSLSLSISQSVRFYSFYSLKLLDSIYSISPALILGAMII